MRRGYKLDWKADYILALCVLVLWSFGRIINPLVHIELSSMNSIGPVLNFFESIYVLLHAALFLYVGVLAVRFFKRNGLSLSWRTLLELLLYIYVLVTLLLSAYFIAYEFSFLPAALQNLIPVGTS